VSLNGDKWSIKLSQSDRYLERDIYGTSCVRIKLRIGVTAQLRFEQQHNQRMSMSVMAFRISSCRSRIIHQDLIVIISRTHFCEPRKKTFHNGKVKNSFGKGVCSNQQHIPLLETGPLQPVHSTDYQLHINDPLLSRAEQDNKPRAEEGAIILRDMNKTTCHFNRRMKCYQGDQDRDATTI